MLSASNTLRGAKQRIENASQDYGLQTHCINQLEGIFQ